MNKAKLAFCIALSIQLLQIGAAIAADKFRVARGGFGTAIHAVLWAAYHKNIFQKYDLDGEYIAIQSETTGMQILLAGEVQCLFSGAVDWNWSSNRSPGRIPKPEDRAQKAWDYWSRAFWIRSRGVGFSGDSNAEDSPLTALMSRLKNSIGQRSRMPVNRKTSEAQRRENGGKNR